MPWSKSDFSRGKGKKKFKVDPIVLKPFHFFVDPNGSFCPRYIPRSGSLVALETALETVPKTGGTVVIADEDWKVDGVIVPMAILLIWLRGTLYTFQVLESDKKEYGVLSLIGVEKTERQPGVATRTAKRGGGMASFSR